jgi:hypothetical protein
MPSFASEDGMDVTVDLCLWCWHAKATRSVYVISSGGIYMFTYVWDVALD